MLGFALLFFAVNANAQLQYSVLGVDEPLRSNVIGHIQGLQFGQHRKATARDNERILSEAIDDARIALRPYGYYQPDISGRIVRAPGKEPVVELTIKPGPPVRVTEVQFEIIGPGKSAREIRSWRRDWPIEVGQVLDQTVWEQQKQQGLDISRSQGFLAAEYTTRALELDLEQNTAVVRLVLTTGPRYVFGDIDYGEHVLRRGIVEYVPRFSKGEYYSASHMDTLRMDLWKTGYFTDVTVTEVVHHDRSPPTVDLELTLKTDTRDYYQGALGFGTDTGMRLNGQFSRHPASSRGDRIDVSVGWREENDEYGVRGTYRMPRRSRIRQYWTADLTIRFENQDLEFKRSDEDENFIKVANGNIDEQHIRFGRLKVRNRHSGSQQLLETMFAQYLRSQRAYELVNPAPELLALVGDPTLDRLLNGIDNVWSVGIDYDRVGVQGRAFQTRGHRDRAWLFTSVAAVGDDVDFTQAYVSMRRSYVPTDRWKFILRGELGYTNAIVDSLSFDAGGEPLNLSVTRLPNFYRFKAGGSSSVRGYGFEQLSNNNVGSNHIITASAEVEFKVLERWSGAVFVDIGNAFNDFDNPELKTGIGVGVRWYSIAGPIRVDIAQAQDFTGKPWRVHFTIGTPLL